VVTMAFFPGVEESGSEEWFAVQVEPKLTQPILAALGQKGYDAFTPFQTVVRKWRDRTSESAVPAFPGYIFARFDLRFRLPVLTTPGVRGVVGYGKQPAPICEEEIETIRRVMTSKLPAKPFPFPQTGDVVRLVAGPLAGLTGILIGQTKHNRFLVRVTLIQQALAVDAELDWVRTLANPTAADPVPEQAPTRARCAIWKSTAQHPSDGFFRPGREGDGRMD
jgi:transcription antitermination factor NusG